MGVCEELSTKDVCTRRPTILIITILPVMIFYQSSVLIMLSTVTEWFREEGHAPYPAIPTTAERFYGSTYCGGAVGHSGSLACFRK